MHRLKAYIDEDRSKLSRLKAYYEKPNELWERFNAPPLP